MPVVVVPYRASGKTRLPQDVRAELGGAMLADVVDAALRVGHVLVVTDEPAAVPDGAETLADPGGGQGPAVAAALEGVGGHALVVNADLPCVTPDALLRLSAHGPALVAAADGTTNALSLPDPTRFEPHYGGGSADRFAAALGLVSVSIHELEHDVDTLDDLSILPLPVGPHTRVVADRHKAALARAR